ncbi:MAG: PAS domain S-box protein, partial [Gammaproteobacteria bacterium]|nr:PAS domain S-box protein [Gammaproteobacteria bacterium]
MTPSSDTPDSGPGREGRLASENAELRVRLQELEDTLHAIHSGDVDALVVNNDIYTLESAHAANNQLRKDVLGQMQDAVFAFDDDDHIIYVNPAAERRYGIASSDVVGRRREEVFREREEPRNERGTGFGALTMDTHISEVESERREGIPSTHILQSGAVLHVESVESPLVDAKGNTFGALAVIRDVTQRRRLEIRREALAGLTYRLRDMTNAIEIAFAAAEVLGTTLDASRVGYGTVGSAGETLQVERDWTAPGVQSRTGSLQFRSYGSFVDSLKRNEIVSIADVRNDERTTGAAEALDQRNASAFVIIPIVEQGVLVAALFVISGTPREWPQDDLDLIREVADRVRTASERARNSEALQRSELQLREANENLEAIVLERTRKLVEAEEALRQAQKMEAVGQLTGGIAHDFNNLLGGMSASLQVLQAHLKRGRTEGLERYIDMGQESIKRAAALTQRLLAFARRQTLDPRPTDLNKLIAGMEELLRRSVGPDVEVEVVGAGGLWTTRIDPSQLENSLLNLCINARDAMLPGGGRLTIETANKWLDERAAAGRDVAPGQYVSLCVTDTGSGMTPEVIQRIFDPFFTTKPLGKGTGLGLSMVYGFVRQSGGQVRVYSELGKGTTMCLYLPRHIGEAEDDEPPVTDDQLLSGDGETVLLIEDEVTIRELVTEVLEEAGYRVFAAGDGLAGLRLLQFTRRVDL